MPRSRTRRRTVWVCQSCGLESSGYYGRCPSCGAWGTMVEQAVDATPATGDAKGTGAPVQELSRVTSAERTRLSLRSPEFDRVLGGGLVPGALVLLGGDPGIGKSTLLLQAALRLASEGLRVLYVAAEESPEQIRLRADRLGKTSDGVLILAETALDRAIEIAQELDPAILIVDSIQTVFLSSSESSPGSVSQVRDCTAQLLQFAKRARTPVFLVGHVTKEGLIAGPRVVEHMVDVVLYLEGERFHQHRLLRAAKNRFGSTNEIGVFEMTDSGLLDVSNPSALFLAERASHAAGSAVVVTLEGTRPILIEVQALTSSAGYGTPRRIATGFDATRLQVLVAVLSKHAGLKLGEQDVFVNVTGGYRLVEPAADLGVALAIASSASGLPLDDDAVFIGELGLAGEVRSVHGLERRLQEAARLGFRSAYVPASARISSPVSGLRIVAVGSIAQAVSSLAVRAVQDRLSHGVRREE
ncbi:DNA repair protein RadA [Thermomicrobium roseum]|uniref:DNA repair protein RadA n=1 Tax=Thermomicrobium roseum (strain ATCC 27502 / DSM 5159 / P-2) TaxID=309801 RepID=B9L030_THERP|nr:DNA repair protein RadA [Thermomicrobium roseum]ACM05687.1 DNA repair protein RadA [Thermomicrobium roseum DSM 5159]